MQNIGDINTLKKIFYTNDSVKDKKLTPFPFNPNTLSAEQWANMGFNDKQVNIIKKYKTKGGKFYYKEDVAKLWGISDSDYKILEPFILLPSKNDSINKNNKLKNDNSKYHKIQLIELNTASEEELISIPGIGKYFAQQIIKRRKLLGGYAKKEQLLEIYKMDTIKFSKIEPYITINEEVIRKININEVSFEELRLHPYFSYNVSLALINYREKHGKFNSIEEIKKCDLITETLFNKILPYITTR